MSDNEYQEFKRYKELLINHLSKVNQKPLIVVVDNDNVKLRLEEVFKYDIQDLSRFNDDVLFSMDDVNLKVFKICTSDEYLKLDDIIKDNSIKRNLQEELNEEN